VRNACLIFVFSIPYVPNLLFYACKFDPVLLFTSLFFVLLVSVVGMF
jgi:hypothetical protein